VSRISVAFTAFSRALKTHQVTHLIGAEGSTHVGNNAGTWSSTTGLHIIYTCMRSPTSTSPRF